jgi:hypothetical protein
MDLILIPVTNGIFPRPDGGNMKGAFLDPEMAAVLQGLPKGHPLFLCPYSPDRGGFYPIGVVAEVVRVWSQEVPVSVCGTARAVTFCEVTGKSRARAAILSVYEGRLIGGRIRPLDFTELRGRGYPVIEGAGWQALGGQTEIRDSKDIRITIYGTNLETGERLGLQGNVGGLIEPEQAHSVEHAIIRSLSQYGLCSPRTIVECLQAETGELKQSVEAGFRLGYPEVFGMTSSGACGNPLTNLAHFYLEKEVIRGLKEGEGFFRSLDEARKKTLSQISDALDISTSWGLRVLQGLKRGMLHDDTGHYPNKMAEVLRRFPASPLE